MFITGCAMVFFSLEKEKIFPITIFVIGMFVFICIIIARRYFNIGKSVVDFERGTITVRNLLMKDTTYLLVNLKSLTIESVVTQNRVLMYNVYADFKEKQVLIGQEPDFIPLKHKIKLINSKIDIELNEEERNVEQDGSSNLTKIIRMMFPMMIILIFLRLLIFEKFNLSVEYKFLIVILVSFGYFFIYYYMKQRRR